MQLLDVNVPFGPLDECVVHLYGVDADGRSVLVRVCGFRPYLCYELRAPGMRDLILGELRKALQCEYLQWDEAPRKRLYGWVPATHVDGRVDPAGVATTPVLRVRFPSLSVFHRAKRLGKVVGVPPWESKVDPVMMFLDETGLVPSSWLRVEATGFATAVGSKRRCSRCTIELECGTSQLRALDDRSEIAPLLVASVDIECFSSTGGFPDASLEGDRVAVIGTCLWRVGTPLDKASTFLQCVGPCAQIDGACVESFASERALIDSWRDLVCARFDVDVVLTYNGLGFDWRYLHERAERAGCESFHFNGRILTSRSKRRDIQLSSNALGDNAMTSLGWEGRIDLDLFHYIKAEYKLDSYKLDAVSEHFLHEHKVDLPYKELFDCLRDGAGPESMARACRYCAEDCRLPLKLLCHLEVLPAMVGMSRVTHSTMHQLVFRGQQIKAFNQIVRFAHRKGYVVNDPPKENIDAFGESYEGAKVLDAVNGFYDTPVVVLDFASLYPSIIIARNLCYSTHVLDERYLDLPGVEYETHAGSHGLKHTFVLSCPGVFGLILKELLAERKAAKRRMAQASTPEARAIADKTQLALKISANSMYGFTGAKKFGMYPDFAIADTVTSCGRVMIERTVDAVPGAVREPCQVVYGDTDSVMVNFTGGGITKERAFEISERAAEEISKIFPGNQLEAEKVCQPFLLLGKKMYAAMTFEPRGDGGGLDDGRVTAKGIALVRRDRCPFEKRVYERVITSILREASPARAITSLREDIEAVVANRVPLTDFVLSMTLKKRESYAEGAKLSHLTVADKIKERSNGARVPQPGDRLPFFIAEGAQARVSDRAEDPEWGMAKRVKPDRVYYVEKIKDSIGKKVFSVFPEAMRREVLDMFRIALCDLELQRSRQSKLNFAPLPRSCNSTSSTHTTATAATTAPTAAAAATASPLAESGHAPASVSALHSVAAAVTTTTAANTAATPVRKRKASSDGDFAFFCVHNGSAWGRIHPEDGSFALLKGGRMDGDAEIDTGKGKVGIRVALPPEGAVEWNLRSVRPPLNLQWHTRIKFLKGDIKELLRGELQRIAASATTTEV